MGQVSRVAGSWLALVAVATTPLFGQSDRGALILYRGTDTVVVDRFIRSADTVKGSVQVKGQPRIDYLVLLAPNDMVLSLTLGVFAPNAAANAEPIQRVRLAVRGDTVIAETAAGVQRIGSKVGAVPMFNNALVLTETFTRRARATGGVADLPYFAVAGGATINVAVRPVTADSLIVTIAQQVERLKVDAVGRILGGTIVGANLEFARLGPEATAGLNVTLRDSAIAPKPDYSAPAGAPYTAEDVRFTGPAGMLAGTLTKPVGARGALPAVVTITGSGQQDRDEYIPFVGGIRLFKQVADTLSRRGIAVLRLDDRGLGGSTGGSIGGTTADFADDIRAAIAFLRARPDIDPNRIALVGHSEGGMIAPMIAATDPRLKAIVLMAGPADRGLEIIMAQNKYVIDRDTSLSPARRQALIAAAREALDPAKQTVPWLKFFSTYDPAATARQVKVATLVLQGATDRQVPADQAEKLASLIRAGGNRNVMVKVIPSTNHLFIDDPDGDFNNYDKLKTNRVGPAVLGPLADWLVRELAARP